MARRRGAHIGADGRWLGIPVRRRTNEVSPKRVFRSVVITMLYIVIGTPTVLHLFYNKTPSAPIAVAVGCGLLLLLTAVVVALHRRRSRLAARYAPSDPSEGLPIAWICATHDAVRVPLAEMRLSARDRKQWIDAAQRRREGESPEVDEHIIAQMNDLKAMFEGENPDELQVARGLAAVIRIIGCDSGSIGSAPWHAIDAIQREMVSDCPRLWLIDDVQVAERDPLEHDAISEPRPAHGARVIPPPTALQANTARWVNLLHAVLTVVGIAALLGLATSTSSAFRGVTYGVLVLFLVLLFLYWLMRLAGSRYDVSIESREIVIRQRGVNEAHPLRVSPSNAWTIVAQNEQRSISGARLPAGEPIWRFVFKEHPCVVEIANFDYRGTAWEPLIEEFLARQREALEAGPPDRT